MDFTESSQERGRRDGSGGGGGGEEGRGKIKNHI